MPTDWRDEMVHAWENSGDHPTIAEAYAEAIRTRDLRYSLYPYLNCTCDDFVVRRIRGRFPWSRVVMLARTIRANSACTVSFQVENTGSGASWSCFTEVWEKPGNRVLASNVTSLMPQESREVSFEVQTGEPGGMLIAVCYDPFFDPIEPENISERQSAPLAHVGLAQREPEPVRFRSGAALVRSYRRFMNDD